MQNCGKVKPSFLLTARKLVKVLYKFRGGQRLADFVRRLFSGYDKTILIDDYDFTLFFHCNLNDHMGSHIFWNGYYSTDQLNIIGKILSDDSVFIDVGANQGEFTLFAAKRAVNGNVIAFEPSKTLFGQLKRNVEINGFKNVMLFNSGLGKHSGTFPLFTSGERYSDGTVHSGLPTLYKTPARSKHIDDVQISALDDFVLKNNITRIDMIKIDVEGSELSALSGARGSIERFKPIIIMEIAAETCNSAGYKQDALLNILRRYNYVFEIINSGAHTSPIENVNQLADFQNVICYPVK